MPAATVALHADPLTARARIVDWMPVIAPGLIWGSSYLFIAESLSAIRPEGVTFVRTVIGFVVLAAVPGVRRPIHRSDRRRAGLLGLIWFAVPMSMFPFAEQWVSSALTGMLNAATPLFVAVIAAGIARRWPTARVAAALLVGMLGSFLIALPSLIDSTAPDGAGGAAELLGIGLVLIALVFYGFAFNLAGPLQQRNGAGPVVWRAVGVAAVLTAPPGLPAVLDANWNTRAVLSLLVLGVLGTGVANLFAAAAAGKGGAIRAGAMGFIIPAVSLALGVGVRGEQVAAVSIIGGAICVAGAWMLAARR